MPLPLIFWCFKEQEPGLGTRWEQASSKDCVARLDEKPVFECQSILIRWLVVFLWCGGKHLMVVSFLQGAEWSLHSLWLLLLARCQPHSLHHHCHLIVVTDISQSSSSSTSGVAHPLSCQPLLRLHVNPQCGRRHQVQEQKPDCSLLVSYYMHSCSDICTPVSDICTLRLHVNPQRGRRHQARLQIEIFVFLMFDMQKRTLTIICLSRRDCESIMTNTCLQNSLPCHNISWNTW